MNDTPTRGSERTPDHRVVRFSLQTLILLTVLASNLMWIYFSPEWKTIPKSSGTISIREGTYQASDFRFRYTLKDGGELIVPTMDLSEYRGFSSPEFIRSPAYSNENAGCLAGIKGVSEVLIWNIASGQRVASFDSSKDLIRCRFGEDETQIVVQTFDGITEIWQRNYKYGWTGQLQRPEIWTLVVIVVLIAWSALRRLSQRKAFARRAP